MTAILSNFNQIKYILLYSRHQRVEVGLGGLSFSGDSNIVLMGGKAYEYTPVTNPNKITYFYDGAPGHILSVDNSKDAMNFNSIEEALQTIKDKFNNKFHEDGECQDYSLNKHTIEYIYTSPFKKTQIVYRFEFINICK